MAQFSIKRDKIDQKEKNNRNGIIMLKTLFSIW